MHGAEVLLLVIAAAAVGGALFERLRLPSAVGFLVAGAVLGPGGFALVEELETVQVIAEFGVAFLLFEIGLELPLDELRRSFRSALGAGVLQVAVSVGAVAMLCAVLGMDVETAILVGMLVAMSSTALVMRLLAVRGEVDSPHGRLALGILLFQDLCIVPFLLAVPILAGEVPREAGPMATAVGGALVKLVVLFAVARFALPWLLGQVARMRSSDLFSLFAFLVAMGTAVVAHVIGLTLAVGAFIGGLVVSASPYATQLFAEVAPLRGVLLGVFFTSVGMLLDPEAALRLWDMVLLYVGGVVAFKAIVVVGIVALILRQGLRTAVQTGLALAQTGEFSFVLAAAATAAGLLGGDIAQVFVAGSILTLVATPFLINAAPRLALRLGAAAPAPAAAAHAEEADHVVIAGYGLAGRTLAGVLGASGIAYRVVDTNPALVERARQAGDPVTFGDITRPAVLEHVGLKRARLFVVAINDPDATRDAIRVARHLAPDVHVVVRTRFAADLDDLFAEGANEIVAEEIESSLDIVTKVLRRFGVAQAAIDHFVEEMREEGYELLRGPLGLRLDPWLAEILEEVSPVWVEVPQTAPGERTIAELGVRARTGASILAVRREGGTTPNPPPSFSIRPGDSLLVLVTGERLGELEALLAGEAAA